MTDTPSREERCEKCGGNGYLFDVQQLRADLARERAAKEEAWKAKGRAEQKLHDARSLRNSEWENRFRVLVGEDSPDAAGNVVIALKADLARLTEQFDALTEAHAADTLTIGDLRVQLAEAKSDLAREHKRATEPPVVTRELARAREGRDKAEAERDALAERVRVAREALEEYGQHTPLCRGQEVNSCDCGLTQALGGRGRE